MQLDKAQTRDWQNFELPDAEFSLLRQLLSPDEAGRLANRLVNSIDWRRDCIQLFGHRHPLPRLHQWYGEPGAVYRWSGLRMEPRPWLPEIAKLRSLVSQTSGQKFNCVLVNYYRDGNDSMGWHADDEPELGPDPAIASLSLGATRTMRLRRRSGPDRMSTSIELESGSLLLMTGPTQQHWQHCVPKRRTVSEARINLTFRHIATHCL